MGLCCVVFSSALPKYNISVLNVYEGPEEHALLDFSLVSKPSFLAVFSLTDPRRPLTNKMNLKVEKGKLCGPD